MIQIYTGTGKGKTTAAVGIATRAVGQGLSVAWIAFDKGGDDYGEEGSLRKLGIKYVRTGRDRRLGEGGFDFSITEKDRAEAKRGLDEAKKARDRADLLVLDEVVGTVSLGLISEEELLNFLDLYKENLENEVVITGRNATEKLIEVADLVTEMKEVKHYYWAGVMARRGIEF